jgi:hypothetical protein
MYVLCVLYNWSFIVHRAKISSVPKYTVNLPLQQPPPPTQTPSADTHRNTEQDNESLDSLFG